MLGSLFRRLVRFVNALFQDSVDVPPDVIETTHGTPTVTIDVCQSDALTQRRGRVPEEVVTPAIAHAMDKARVSYRIRRNFNSVSLGVSERPVEIDTLDAWRDMASPDADVMLCLVDAAGAGYGEVDGRYSVMGCSSIKRRFEPIECDTPLSAQCRNVRGAIHEVGHNLGGVHQTPILADTPRMEFSDEMIELIKSKLAD